ncbi:MAG: DegT/DnrJ/EryC1/StrS family aminotransferase [Rhodospirillales bacterium]
MSALDSSTESSLAIHGGTPVRAHPMPPRFALGPGEEAMIAEVIAYYRKRGQDPGYDGEFENRYRRAIEAYMGGGYADAVNSGTAAIYIALMALDLPKDSEVLVSPITETGSVSPIIMAGLTPKVVDSKPRHYNIGVEQVCDRITDKTSAIVVVHAGGQPVSDIAEITREAHARGIRVVEDTSQAIGGTVDGRIVGSFGDIAAWSSGSRKNQISGGAGGVVYTQDRDLMRRVVAHADRGKPKMDPGFEDRNPDTYMLPALNLNADEIGCAIGISSLARLNQTKERRLAFVHRLDALIAEQSTTCTPYGYTDGDSPFFQPVILDPKRSNADKIEFALAVQAEGIGLNPHFKFFVADWNWMKPYMADDMDTPNARWIRDHSFNVFLNENYTEAEAFDVIAAIRKVEQLFTG